MPPDLHSLPRPSWLLAKPLALLMHNHRPFYGSQLRTASNSERIEAGCWRQTKMRYGFIAEGNGNALYWINRECINGSGDDAATRWCCCMVCSVRYHLRGSDQYGNHDRAYLTHPQSTGKIESHLPPT